MAQSITNEAINSELLVQLDTTKQMNKQAHDHTTLSAVYLLSDSANKAEKAATKSKGLGSTAPAGLGSSGDPSGLTPDELAQLKSDLAKYQQIEQAYQAFEDAGMGSDAQAAFKAALNKIMGGQNFQDLFKDISSLIVKSGSSDLVNDWGAALKSSFLLARLSQLKSEKLSDEINFLVSDFIGDKTRQDNINKMASALNIINVDVYTLPTGGPTPTPSGSGVKAGDMLSFKTLFALMMKLMDSQQNAQTQDANMGSKLSKQESTVITQMAASLQNYYSQVVEKASKTDLPTKTANMNMYKTEWDNFKDQVDSMVQNQTTAAGTTDVNNIQQTSDFEKDVLQTWGNVANQIAAL